MRAASAIPHPRPPPPSAIPAFLSFAAILAAFIGRRLLRAARCGCLIAPLGDIGCVHSQCRRQRDLVVLFLNQYLAMCFATRVLAQRLALANALAVITDRFVLIFQIDNKHVLGLLRGLNRLRNNFGHASEIVNLVGDDQRVLKFFAGMRYQLRGGLPC